MATWTNIADTVLEPGKPIRAIDARALRDNPIAIAEGASGAPKIETAGIDDGAITNAKIQPPTAGTAHLIMRLQEAEVINPFSDYANTGLNNRFSFQRHLGVTCLVAGTITAYAEHRRIDLVTSFLRVLKNGAVIEEFSTNSASFVTRTVNISVEIGDQVIFQARGTGGTTEWRRLRIYSNNPNFAVA